MDFDAAQREVIEAEGGYHIALAPPGCGKTEILAERVRRALAQGIDPGEMLCLTFTNRAARNMEDRVVVGVSGVLNEEKRPFVGNVHRFCAKILRDAGIIESRIAIIDEEDVVAIAGDLVGTDAAVLSKDSRAYRTLKGIAETMRKLQHRMRQIEKGYPERILLHRDTWGRFEQAFGRLCKAWNVEPDEESLIRLWHDIEPVEEATPMDVESDENIKDLIGTLRLAKRYEACKAENGLADFDDLLLGAWENVDVVGRKWRWVEVDETQDLNPLQIDIIDRYTDTSGQFTTLYLGDKEQAIYAFIGASVDMLHALAERCENGRIYNLQRNYRSPSYLLDVFNTYAREELHISERLLPHTPEKTEAPKDALIARICRDEEDELKTIGRAIAWRKAENPDESIAVVVSSNEEADLVLYALEREGVETFGISGSDTLDHKDIKLIKAHMDILRNERNMMGWARILTGMGIASTGKRARRMMTELKAAGLTPMDALREEDPVEALVHDTEGTLVVFDTETTGLSIEQDDIVQLAAVKMRNGIVDESTRLNLYIESARPLPEKVGGVRNPLAEEYARHDKLRPEEAFVQFAEYAREGVLVGHNADYDVHILRENIGRHCGGNTALAEWAEQQTARYHDTLGLARRLNPRERSYRLGALVEAWHLQGENSHKADEDVAATAEVVRRLAAQARETETVRNATKKRYEKAWRKLRAVYGEFAEETRARLWTAGTETALADEMERVYERWMAEGIVGEHPKLRRLLGYMRQNMRVEGERMLRPQMDRWLTDLGTIKEADLCGALGREGVVVGTVHKVKGLEFDTVMVYNAVAERYPMTWRDNREGHVEEEKRRFYVALSRAKRRLLLFVPEEIERRGREMRTHVTSFVETIKEHFKWSKNQ